MKVTLAYPYEDDEGKSHDPDSTLDLPDPVAKRLLHDGLARSADTARVSTAKNKEA